MPFDPELNGACFNKADGNYGHKLSLKNSDRYNGLVNILCYEYFEYEWRFLYNKFDYKLQD